jgi:peroxiredoxin
VKQFAVCLIAALISLSVLGFSTRDAEAAPAKRLPTFDMKGLDETEHSLTDDQFKDKKILVAAFGTWQQPSIEQARELEKFHKAHPDVEIIAFVVDSLPSARDFVAREGLSFDCYKTDGSAPIGTSFNRLFETKRGRTLTLNRIPFVILTDKDRNVEFANLGATSAETLGEELGKIGE